MGRFGTERNSALLDLIAHHVVPKATEGICIRAFKEGRTLCNLSYGNTYPFYDWASLTKVVFSVTELMRLWEAGTFDLSDRLIKLLPWAKTDGVTIRELLNHTSGLEAWSNFYEKIDWKEADIEVRRMQLQRELQRAKLQRKSKRESIYSDIDFLFLGFLMERLREKPLESIWQSLSQELSLEQTVFSHGNRPVFLKTKYAPTQFCLGRGFLVQGEVDDFNAWSMGGVSSHAGLLGPMRDLERWAMGLRAAWYGARDWVVKPQTIRKFGSRAIPRTQGDWALGFMLPTSGKSSCGKFFSPNSIGHTGWTGTSWWFDPDQDLVILILSNRVFPSYELNSYVGLRSQIHDWIYEIYVKG